MRNRRVQLVILKKEPLEVRQGANGQRDGAEQNICPEIEHLQGAQAADSVGNAAGDTVVGEGQHAQVNQICKERIG